MYSLYLLQPDASAEEVDGASALKLATQRIGNKYQGNVSSLQAEYAQSVVASNTTTLEEARASPSNHAVVASTAAFDESPPCNTSISQDDANKLAFDQEQERNESSLKTSSSLDSGQKKIKTRHSKIRPLVKKVDVVHSDDELKLNYADGIVDDEFRDSFATASICEEDGNAISITITADDAAPSLLGGPLDSTDSMQSLESDQPHGRYALSFDLTTI